MKRNEELESEVERLRLHISKQKSPSIPPQATSTLRRGSSLPQKESLQWVPETAPWPTTGLPSHIPTLDRHESSDIPEVARYQMEEVTYPSSSGSFEDTEDPQHLYGTATPIWEDPKLCDPNTSLTRPATAWTPFHPTLSQPSRFADLQPSGFSEVINTPNYASSNCWQTQPSIYAWQISTVCANPFRYL